MQELDMKKKVADEIMALMDQKDGERLKMHPKLKAASPAPELSGEGDEAEDELLEGAAPAEETASLGEGEELDPETIKQLIEMMSGN